jgi:hypothetical protein
MSIYPANDEPEDGTLTSPEVRRLILDVARERYLAASNVHLRDYVEAKLKYERTSAHAEKKNVPFPEYKASDLDAIYLVLLNQAKIQVLAMQSFDLTPNVPITNS